MRITILGNGIFGSAMASYLTRIGHDIAIDIIDNSEVILFVSLHMQL